MTLALLTRGYICLGKKGGTQLCGPGPGIVSVEDISPKISGAGTEDLLSPEILGAGPNVPMGVATVEPAPPSIEPPEIVGGDDMAPGIEKGS
jgi:hypothetical protein